MKTCMQCGAEAADDMTSCQECDYRFVYVGSAGGEGFHRVEEQAGDQRPTGEAPMQIGWLCLAASLVTALLGMSRDSFGSWGLMLLAAAFFQLFLVFWGVGYVVRAISFLPERGRAAE
jgi:hypothetical protein